MMKLRIAPLALVYSLVLTVACGDGSGGYDPDFATGGQGAETSGGGGGLDDSGGGFGTGGATGNGGSLTSGGGSVNGSGATDGSGGADGGGAADGSGGSLDGSGGDAASGGDGAGGSSGGSPAALDDPLFPAPGATGVCPDPSLRFRFDGAPKLGSSGKIQVHDASNGNVVASVDMSVSQISDKVGGATFNLPRPAYVHEHEAIFVLPAAGLGYGKSYYVTLDSGVLSGPDGPVSAITDPQQWRFTTTSAASSSKSNLRVALDGVGQFCSIQGAIDYATTGTKISVGPSSYYGVVYFKSKNSLSISGDDRDTTRIAGVNNNNLNPSTRGRALFGLESVSNFLIEDITIENETPQGGSQAEALAMLSCDKCIVRNTTVRSLQDTLLWSGKIYAEDCLIEGNVDYIWGTGTAYFNRCEIKTVGRSGYNIQARNGDNYGYVFVDSKLTSSSGITGDVLARIDVTEYPKSHVAYIDCEMGSHISPAGWTITGGGSTSSIRFWEYKSKTPQGGLVNTSSRAAGSKQLSDNEAAQMRDVTNVLGGWDPTP